MFWRHGHPMHLYMVLDCKTQKCKTVHALMHLGEKGKTPARVENWMSYPLTVDCPTCGKTYDSDAEAKFWQKELPAPPRGFSNRLAPPLSRPDPLPRKTEVHILFTVIGLEVSRLKRSQSAGRSSRVLAV